MKTNNWKYIYKKEKDGTKTATNVMYTPTMNQDGSLMCMTWNENSKYIRDNGHNITKELVDFFYLREVENLTRFQEYHWCPKIHHIDKRFRKIVINWNKKSINSIIYENTNSLSEICPNWEEQIFSIINDIYNAGYYKLGLYPHCFFIDKDNYIKPIDFYTCVSIEERYIKKDTIEGVIGKHSTERFDLSTTPDGLLDFKIFFELTMTKQLKNYWPINPFPKFYRKLTNV